MLGLLAAGCSNMRALLIATPTPTSLPSTPTVVIPAFLGKWQSDNGMRVEFTPLSFFMRYPDRSSLIEISADIFSYDLDQRQMTVRYTRITCDGADLPIGAPERYITYRVTGSTLYLGIGDGSFPAEPGATRYYKQ